MARLNREKPSKNIEDRRKARVYLNERQRDEVTYEARKGYIQDKMRPLENEEDRGYVERASKRNRLKNTNLDRQSDVTRDTKSIRKRISEDYQNWTKKK